MEDAPFDADADARVSERLGLRQRRVCGSALRGRFNPQ